MEQTQPIQEQTQPISVQSSQTQQINPVAQPQTIISPAGTTDNSLMTEVPQKKSGWIIWLIVVLAVLFAGGLFYWFFL